MLFQLQVSQVRQQVQFSEIGLAFMNNKETTLVNKTAQ